MHEERQTHLAFEGALTLRNAETLCSRLKTALQAGPVVAITCDPAAEVDLSFIQLLLSARRSAETAGGRVTLASEPSGVLWAALMRAGFTVVAEPGGFWFRGTAS